MVFLRTGRPLRQLGWILAGLSLLSTAAMVLLRYGGADLDRLYYGTDTRAAEILVGSTLAIFLHLHPIRPGTRFASRVLPVAGIGAFAISSVGMLAIPLEDGPMWSGGMLVFACLSALTIASLVNGAGPLVKVLDLKPLVWTGKTCYGIYLFHWPLFLWLDEERTGLDSIPLLALRLAVTLPLAYASYNLVERRILQHGLPSLSPPSRLLAGPAIVLAIVAAAVVIPAVHDAPDPLETIAATGDAPRRSRGRSGRWSSRTSRQAASVTRWESCRRSGRSSPWSEHRSAAWSARSRSRRARTVPTRGAARSPGSRPTSCSSWRTTYR